MKLRLAILTLCIAIAESLTAQVKLTPDTIHAPIIGFSAGIAMPSSLSFAATADGNHLNDGTIKDLYKGPYLNFGINTLFKTRTNWLYSIDGTLTIGNDNLNNRVERMSHIYTTDSIIIGTNGTDGIVTCYNRGLSLTAGVGHIFNLDPKTPNSGIVTKLNAGYYMNKTVFMINEVNAPQVDGNYAKLYDHFRQGFQLTESLGYLFMSKTRTIINLYVSFEVSQMWGRCNRPYVIDDRMGLAGPDNNHYFDMVYSLKLCWMFPLTGKPHYDYYFY